MCFQPLIALGRDLHRWIALDLNLNCCIALDRDVHYWIVLDCDLHRLIALDHDFYRWISLDRELHSWIPCILITTIGLSEIFFPTIGSSWISIYTV